MPSLGKKYALQMGLPLQAENPQLGAIALIVLSLSIMSFGRFEADMVERLRVGISDSVTPTLVALSAPVEALRDIGVTFVGLTSLRQDNVRLRESVMRLQRWQTVAHSLSQENESLRELLHYRDIPWPSYISAKVIAASGNSFVRAVLISAGYSDAVKAGQAVMAGPGLVGRVVETGARSSNVLLLTDLNSRIPVIVGEQAKRGILAGDNTDITHLDLLSGTMGVEVGMRVTTSGHGGKLPPGVPIGRVSAINGERITVQPFVDFSRLEHVVVAAWSLEGVPNVTGSGVSSKKVEGERAKPKKVSAVER
tara:strand:+ start:631 stop:1557 length:927 start_codon:yes stop_codon:yes gene_type:complete